MVAAFFSMSVTWTVYTSLTTDLPSLSRDISLSALPILKIEVEAWFLSSACILTCFFEDH